MKKLTIIAVAAWMLAACTTVKVVERKNYGEIAFVEPVNEYGCRYRITVWDAGKGKFVKMYTNTLYSIGSTIELR